MRDNYSCTNQINDRGDTCNVPRPGNRKDKFLMQTHRTTTPSGNPKTFDRNLSLAIDKCHWQLDQLAGRRDPIAMLRRAYVRLSLRWLERQIPHV